jgi:hypothetical protein
VHIGPKLTKFSKVVSSRGDVYVYLFPTTGHLGKHDVTDKQTDVFLAVIYVDMICEMYHEISGVWK